MAYMIVAFAHANGSAPCLYLTNGYAGQADSSRCYTYATLEEAREAADRNASSFSMRTGRGYTSAQYAVFQAGGRPRSSLSDFSFDLLRSPVYVPEACKEAARAQGWVIPGEQSEGDGGSGCIEGPVATAALYPIDPTLPLELEDGTPCELVFDEGQYINVRIQARPEGPMPDSSYPVTWNYYRDRGHWVGDDEGKYLKLRNRLPVVSPIVPAAIEAASKPKPAPTLDAPQVRFEVRAGLNGTNRDEWSAVAQFDSGKEAADWQKENGSIYRDAGKSLAIVRVELTAPSVDWRAREQGRLDDGTYIPLPGRWYEAISSYYPDHFPHVSSSDKRKVAFTETEAAGEKDRQKVLSAVEYTRRFLQTKWYSSTCDEFFADMLGSSCNVLFTPLGNANALSTVYMECDENGYDVGSCMTHSESDYQSDFHPVEVYAMGGDLTLAFLRGYGDDACDDDGEGEAQGRYDCDPNATWDGEGPIIARCLVWPEEKQFGRLYGSGDRVRLLRTALQALGYSEGDLSGARIAKVKTEYHSSCECDECNIKGHEAFVMPYLDCGDCRFSDGGDTWLVGSGGEGCFVGNSTSGVSLVPVPVACDHCGGMVDGNSVLAVTVAEGDEESWCSSCFSSVRVCDHTSVYIPNDEAVTVEINNRYRAAYAVASWAVEDFIDGLDDTPVMCSDGVYRNNAFQCRDCGETFAVSEREVMTRDGRQDHVCGTCATERRASPDLPLTIAA